MNELTVIISPDATRVVELVVEQPQVTVTPTAGPVYFEGSAGPHAETHATGGTDPLSPAMIGAAPSSHTHLREHITDFTHTHLRSDISDFSHASTHKSTGTDPLSPGDIGAASQADFQAHAARQDNPHNVTASQVGALVSIDGVSNPGGNVDLVAGTGITIAPDATLKRITIAATGEAAPGPHASTHAAGGTDPVSPASIGAETPAGAQAKVDAHNATNTGVHGVGAGYIAKTSRADQLVPWGEIQDKPSSFPPEAHTHPKADITDFAHGHVKADITDFAHKASHATGGADALTPADIGAAAASHSHTASEVGAVANAGSVPSLASGLDAERPLAGTLGRVYIATDTKVIYRDDGASWVKIGVTDWADITGKPSAYPPEAHKASHATGGADALTPADIGAAPASHTHTAAQVGALSRTGDTLQGNLNFADYLCQSPEIRDYSETCVVANSGTSYTINLESGNVFEITLTGSCTLAFSNPPASGKAGSCTLILRQDATGGRSVTWPSSVKWPGGVPPTLSTGANQVDILVFLTTNGGATWYGFLAGGGMA